ncbi:MAG: hypothetical protein V1867_05225 [Candidatus Falkowbacteria bacterium]
MSKEGRLTLFQRLNYFISGQLYLTQELKRAIGWSIVTAALAALFWGIYYSTTGKYCFEMNMYFFAPWIRESYPWLLNRFWDIVFAPFVVGPAVWLYEHQKTHDLVGFNVLNVLYGALLILAGILLSYMYIVLLLATVLGLGGLGILIIRFFIKGVNAVIDRF